MAVASKYPTTWTGQAKQGERSRLELGTQRNEKDLTGSLKSWKHSTKEYAWPWISLKRCLVVFLAQGQFEVWPFEIVRSGNMTTLFWKLKHGFNTLWLRAFGLFSTREVHSHTPLSAHGVYYLTLINYAKSGDAKKQSLGTQNVTITQQQRDKGRL